MSNITRLDNTGLEENNTTIMNMTIKEMQKRKNGMEVHPGKTS